MAAPRVRDREEFKIHQAYAAANRNKQLNGNYRYRHTGTRGAGKPGPAQSQRLQHTSGHRERVRFTVCQLGFAAQHFQMGVPVSGKNLFPSNIAGLPTWYTIRASKHGYVARKKEIDFLVAMNAETANEDVMTLPAGAVCVYDEPLNLNQLRTDITFYPVPFDKLVAPVCPDAKLRRLVKNMIYVGVVDFILSIDLHESENAVARKFSTKKKAAELNMNAVRAGFDYAKATFTKQDPFSVEPMKENTGKIIIDGNAAAALGCMFAGVTVVTWYPITPSTSLIE